MTIYPTKSVEDYQFAVNVLRDHSIQLLAEYADVFYLQKSKLITSFVHYFIGNGKRAIKRGFV